eukprot:TRINITY_DN8550_c0_g1_i2.p1 TRINITY_DN8550_c0_g1~~TRINITY_DN8550_c0_g1_i2.p1  ORF type:complete len:271 (+),score=64.87 TRINITY_DN8550_c0_g1_i2:149-961(+)
MEQRAIILDLDGTLLHSEEVTHSFRAESWNVKPDYVTDMVATFFRPHLRVFVKFLREHFSHVAVWTLGSKSYAEEKVEQVFGRDHGLAFVWSAKQCVRRSARIWRDLEWDAAMGNMDWHKPLHKVFRKRRFRQAGIEQHNTLILEDTPSNCTHNYGNALYIRSFEPVWPWKCHLDATDDQLLRLIAYLSSDVIIRCPNFRSLEKRGWHQNHASDAPQLNTAVDPSSTSTAEAQVGDVADAVATLSIGSELPDESVSTSRDPLPEQAMSGP